MSELFPWEEAEKPEVVQQKTELFPWEETEDVVEEEKFPWEEDKVVDITPEKSTGMLETFGRTIEKKKFTEDEIKKLASNYGRDEAWIKDAILSEGGDIEFKDIGEAAKATIPGTIGEVQQKFLLGVPRKITRMLADDKDKKVLDDIATQVRLRDSVSDIASSMFAVGAPVNGVSKSVAPLLAKLPKTKKVIDIATPGVLGGIAGFGGSKEGEEIKGTLIGTATGTAMQSLMKYWHLKLTPKQKENLTDRVLTAKKESEEFTDGVLKRLKGEELTDIDLDNIASKMDISEKSIKDLQKRLEKRGTILSEEEVIREFVSRKLDTDILNFTRNTLRAEYPDMKLSTVPMIKENVAKQMSKSQEEQAFISLLYDRYRTIKATKNLIRDEVIGKYMPEEATRINRVMDTFSSAQHTLTRKDERWGTSAEKYLHDLSDDYMKYQDVATRIINDEYVPLLEAVKRAEGDRTQIYKYIENENLTPPKELEGVVTAVKDFYSNVKKEAENLGLPIDEVTNYFTRRIKTPDNLRASVERELSELADIGIDLAEKGVNGRQFTKLAKGPKAKSLIKFLGDFTGRKITRGSDIALALNDISTMQATGGLDNYLAGSLRSRKGEIPEFARETDPLKIALGYVNSVFKTATMRNSLANMTKARKMFEEVGDIDAANYVQNIIDSTLGRKTLRSGTFARQLSKDKATELHFNELNIARKQVELEASKAGVTDQAKLKEIQTKIDMLELDKQSWQVGEMLGNLMYAETLGWDYTKPLRNMTQPFVLTASEVGGIYGQKLAVRGFAKSLTNAKEIAARLASEGKLVGKWRHDYVKDIADEMSNSKYYKSLPRKRLEKYAQMGLYLYSKSDTWNRIVTANMASELAANYKAGVKQAVSFVDNTLSPGYQNAIKAGEISVESAIENFLLAKTQFQYSKVALAAFTRDLHPIFRSFSKWPTEIAGDVYTKLYKLGDIDSRIATAFNKYLGPYAMASMYDKYYSEYAAESPRAQMLVGKSGKIAQKMPVANIFSLGAADFLETPHIQVLSDVSTGKYKPAFNKILTYYIPLGPVDFGFRTYQLLTGEEAPTAKERIKKELSGR